MNTNTELTEKPRDLKAMIASPAMQQQFAAALPSHLSPERFGRIAITALTRTPKLKECTQESVFKCLLDLSAMGLEPDGRHAHLIPYGKECTLIIDYKGLVALVRRSGEVAKIHADIVCENDIFQHSMGEVKAHTFDLRNPRGDTYAAYAQVTLKDGSVQAAILSKDEIDSVRKRSRSGGTGPWATDWNEMAKKTAFRRLTKWLTLSPEIADVIAKADEHEFGGMRDATPKAHVLPTANPFRIAEPEPAKEEPAPEPEPDNAREEAAQNLREGIAELEIQPVKFWKLAKLNGWIGDVDPKELTAAELDVLAINREEIAKGVVK